MPTDEGGTQGCVDAWVREGGGGSGCRGGRYREGERTGVTGGHRISRDLCSEEVGWCPQTKVGHSSWGLGNRGLGSRGLGVMLCGRSRGRQSGSQVI